MGATLDEENELVKIRAMLRRLLTMRCGPLPDSLVRRIEATTILVQLRAAVEQSLQIQTLDELRL